MCTVFKGLKETLHISAHLFRFKSFAIESLAWWGSLKTLGREESLAKRRISFSTVSTMSLLNLRNGTRPRMKSGGTPVLGFYY